MKKILGVMLLATLMAGCSSTTPMNKDTTLGDLLGIGPISLPAGYGGQGATTKPAQGITAQSMITQCEFEYLMIQGRQSQYPTPTKEGKVTKLASGNYLVTVYITLKQREADKGEWDQSVCEYDENGKSWGGRINYYAER